MPTSFLLVFNIILLSALCYVTAKIEKQLNHELLDDIKKLSSDQMEGRRTGSKGSAMARQYLISRLRAIGAQPFSGPGLVGYEQPFDYFFNNGAARVGPIPGRNVVSFVPGKVGKDVIVVSAHYDHLGVFRGQTYNGADDNASGSAGILQLAKHFVKNPPMNTLIFVHFDAEDGQFEHGGLTILPMTTGSHFFVENPPLPLDKIKLNINVDMISHNSASELYVLLKNVDTSPFRPYLHDDRVKLILRNKAEWPMSSDSDQFAAKGIPYVYFSVQAHQDYHRPSDRFENINQTFVIDTVEALIKITKTFDELLADGKKFDDTNAAAASLSSTIYIYTIVFFFAFIYFFIIDF